MIRPATLPLATLPLAALLLLGTAALADPVEVTVRPAGDLAGQPFQWEAYPLDLPDAEVEAAIAASGGAVAGDWTVALEPGLWQVSGFGDAGVLSGTISVAEAGAVFEIAEQEEIPPPPYPCPDIAEGCLYSDAETLIEFRVPLGWAADQPMHFDLGDGTLAPEVSMVFFEGAGAEGGEVWFLNPMDWSEELGPCRETALGNLCTFSVNAESDAAFAVIAPSLRRITAEEAAAP